MEGYQAPKAEWKELASGVYAYIQPARLGESNAGLIVGEKDAIVVDTLLNKPMMDGFISKIKEVTDKPVRFVINSHSDIDHVATNHFFPEATSIATYTCRKEVVHLRPMVKMIIQTMQKMFPDMSYEGADMIPQDLAFEKKLTLYQGEREIQLIELGQGHSASDTIVYLPEEKVVFCGDAVIVGLPPRIGESIILQIEALDYMAKLDADIYLPGHGPLGGKEVVTDYRDFLAHFQNEARKCFDKGIDCLEAAKVMDMGKYKVLGHMVHPAALAMNLPRAYVEFKGGAPGSPLPKEINFQKIMDDFQKLMENVK